MTETEINKADQRARLRKIRNGLDPRLRAENSRLIAERLFETEEYKNAECVLVYMPVQSEVDTSAVTNRLLDEGKRVAVPRCGSNSKMDAFVISSLDELETGSYGIQEPSLELIKDGVLVPLEKSEIDLIIVPGLGFDKSGYRIGYGKGYYDRYLSDYIGESIGLCFDECLIPGAAHSEYDISIGAVITESRMVRISNNTEQ